MKKATFVAQPYYLNNRIFSTDPVINRDNRLGSFISLKKEFAKRGVDLNTQDITPPETADYVLWMEMPAHLPPIADKKKNFLIIGEVEAVMPHNWVMAHHNHFGKIFTFCDDLIDNKRYFKLNSARQFIGDVPQGISHKNKLCCLISGNKTSTHPSELYSARVAAARWFEENHPRDFDFYGEGWDKKVFTGILRPFNRIPPVGRFFAPRFPSYKGRVDNKHTAMLPYTFAVAFENAQGINGYVTSDKIFDPMLAGVIPIYWGAPNITTYVPPECFVDFRDFDCDWNNAYKFMKSLTPKRHKQYLADMHDYIDTVARKGTHSADVYVTTLVKEVLGKKA